MPRVRFAAGSVVVAPNLLYVHRPVRVLAEMKDAVMACKYLRVVLRSTLHN